MSRSIAGLACRIRVPVRQYQAVAVVVRERTHSVRLLHRDNGLSVDVEAFDSLATAEDYRDRLAGFLDLPPLMLAGAPSEQPEVDCGSISPRPRHPCLRRRRARFLTRRRTGAAVSLRRIDGSEIIART